VVKLRLKRFGRKNRPVYRLNAMDTRVPRNGRSIEELGSFDPLEKDVAKQTNFNMERVNYWLSKGAQASETVAGLLRRQGITVKGHKPRATRVAKPAEAAPAAEAPKA
jgi:small subunit ribosomal protein S16